MKILFSDDTVKDFKFKTKPFDHQIKAFNLSRDKEYYALFMEQGTGKSKVIIDNIAYLYRNGKINAAIIIAPKGVYRNWEQAEIPIHMPDDVMDYTIMHIWKPTETKSNIKQLKDFLREDTHKLKLFIINIEAFSTTKGLHYTQRFLNVHKTMIIVDESSTIKHRTARRTKNILKLTIHSKYRRVLTGTPITQGPLDIYTQMAFLSEYVLNCSYYGFRNRYCVLRRRTINMKTFHEIVDYQNLDELQDLLKDHAFRVTKDECLDLPEKIYQKREIELSKDQKKIYELLRKKAYIELSKEKTVTAPLVITRLLRLHQVLCGFVKHDDGTEEPIPGGNPRLQELIQVLEETKGQVIIWANYRRSIREIQEKLKDYFKIPVASYFGETRSEDRQDIINKFQNGYYKYLISNPRTGGYGLTLTAATTVIYYANTYDLEARLQSEDRPHRIGQKNNVTYIDFITPKTIDEKIFKSLKTKKSLANTITGDNWKEWI